MKTPQQWQPARCFDWDKMNHSERSRQVRWLAPLLGRAEGRTWFLQRLDCPCSRGEAEQAEVSHLLYPLRDLVSYDYQQCRGFRHLEDEFMAYYNGVFRWSDIGGIDRAWRSAAGDEIRHPGAKGRAGWSDALLEKHITNPSDRERVRQVREMLATEADLLLLTAHHVVLVECKFKGALSEEQAARQEMMADTLARVLQKTQWTGAVVECEDDAVVAGRRVRHVLWQEIKERLTAP